MSSSASSSRLVSAVVGDGRCAEYAHGFRRGDKPLSRSSSCAARCASVRPCEDGLRSVLTSARMSVSSSSSLASEIRLSAR